MDNFLKEYKGHTFDDWGSICSNDFKSFARKFSNYLKRNLPSDYMVCKHQCNHYDLSGFVKHNETCMYYSYSWNRFSPVEIDTSNYLNGGILIRYAKNENDFHGEFNHYTSLSELPASIKLMISRREALNG